MAKPPEAAVLEEELPPPGHELAAPLHAILLRQQRLEVKLEALLGKSLEFKHKGGRRHRRQLGSMLSAPSVASVPSTMRGTMSSNVHFEDSTPCVKEIFAEKEASASLELQGQPDEPQETSASLELQDKPNRPQAQPPAARPPAPATPEPSFEVLPEASCADRDSQSVISRLKSKRTRSGLEPSLSRGASGKSSRFAVLASPEEAGDDCVPNLSSDPSVGHRGSVAKLVLFIQQQSPVQQLVTSRYFEGIAGLMIMLNAFFIGLETQWIAVEGSSNQHFVNMHLSFSIYFISELVLRLIAYGPAFFWNEEYRWNWLDAFLVITSFVDLFFAFNARFASAGRSIRALRLVRLARTIRVIRTLKAVREFHKMVYALLSSLRTLMCSMLILFFVMYFFAIFFCQAVSDYKQADSETLNQDLLDDLVPLYNDLSLSFYTLFMCISTGTAWSEGHVPLARLHWFYGAAFITFIATVLFGVMNVVTSVFVESAIMSAQHYKDLIIQEKQHERDIAMSHMKKVFSQIDTDGSGEITVDEMELFLERPHLRKYMEALNISAEDTRMLFRLLDRDGSHKIDIHEFSEGCLRLQGEAKSFDIHSMIYTIKQFLHKWSDFTGYVEERFDRLFEDEDYELDQADHDGFFVSGRGSSRSSAMTLVNRLSVASHASKDGDGPPEDLEDELVGAAAASRENV